MRGAANFSSIAAGAFGRRDIGYRSKTEDYAAPRGHSGTWRDACFSGGKKRPDSFDPRCATARIAVGSVVEGRLGMKNLHGGRILLATVATIAGVGLAACGGGVAPVENRAAADEVAAAWANALMPETQRRWQRSTPRTHIRCLREQERSAVVRRLSLLAPGHRGGWHRDQADAQRFHRAGRPCT